MAARLVLALLLMFPILACAAQPTSDLLTSYDGPVIKVPLMTLDANGNTTWKDIKVPYAGEPRLPYVCFRQGKVQKITCLIIGMNTYKADFYEVYLREVET